MNGPTVVLSLPVNPGNTAEDLNTTSETVANVRSAETLKLTYESYNAALFMDVVSVMAAYAAITLTTSISTSTVEPYL
jgi:hypothetical protein